MALHCASLQIYGAIVWNSFGPKWDYSIRMNSSDVPTTLSYTNNLQRNVNLQYMHQYFGITLSENQLAALATQKNGLEQAANRITPGFVPIQIAIDRCVGLACCAAASLFAGSGCAQRGSVVTRHVCADAVVVVVAVGGLLPQVHHQPYDA